LKSEKDYSDFIHHYSNVQFMVSMYYGFTMTIFVLFISLFPDLSSLIMQTTLFLLLLLLRIFHIVMIHLNHIDLGYIKELPPYTRDQGLCDILLFLSTTGLGLVQVLAFFFVKLINLALISLVVLAVSLVFDGFFTIKPYMERRGEVI
jgi:hypothetical protein